VDIVFEALRAAFLGAVFSLMILRWKSPEISKIGGWNQLLFGFGLLFFGAAIDLTDNFPELEKWIIIGETPVQVFLEELVGYLLGSLLLAIGFFRWLPKIIEHDRQNREQLEKATSEIKTLSGLLPICASCKKIRDDQGYWSQIEGYISSHSEATFSHSICPDCAKKLYPGMDLYPNGDR
jgi:hypothetical protein